MSFTIRCMRAGGGVKVFSINNISLVIVAFEQLKNLATSLFLYPILQHKIYVIICLLMGGRDLISIFHFLVMYFLILAILKPFM